MEAFQRRLRSSEPVSGASAEVSVGRDPPQQLSGSLDADASRNASSELAFAARVAELMHLTRAVWEALPDDSFPETTRRWTPEQQKKTHSRLLQLRTKVGSKEAARESMTLSLGVNPDFVNLMESSGVFDASRSFAWQAKAFDASLPEASEFQAGRNAWAAFALQLRSSEGRADCSAAITGYSLLYPYSDNLLDDPERSASYKESFQRRFMSWLRGEPPMPGNVPQSKDEEHVLVRKTFCLSDVFLI